MLFMEILKTVREGDRELQNHIRIERGNYIHKQIEKRGELVFMRIKSRKLFEIEST